MTLPANKSAYQQQCGSQRDGGDSHACHDDEDSTSPASTKDDDDDNGNERTKHEDARYTATHNDEDTMTMTTKTQ